MCRVFLLLREHYIVVAFFDFFFFKQKTAYEMRISDWSSDVCSSELAGFKTTLFDRKVTLNGGVFYYDYKNKQLRAKIVDPFFNALDGLVNVPKSRVKGAELELSARVVEGLTVSAAATYIDAKVRHYQGIVGSVANEV